MANLWIPGEPDPSSLVDDYSDAKHEKHAHGLVIVDGKEVATTLQCPHCGGHFVSRKGSGKRRDYCLKCDAICCGGEMTPYPYCHPDYYHGVLGRKHYEAD